MDTTAAYWTTWTQDDIDAHWENTLAATPRMKGESMAAYTARVYVAWRMTVPCAHVACRCATLTNPIPAEVVGAHIVRGRKVLKMSKCRNITDLGREAHNAVPMHVQCHTYQTTIDRDYLPLQGE